MEARAKLFGHPIHQMLIAFPLGVLGSSIIFDILYLITKHGRWADIAYWMILVGVISGLWPRCSASSTTWPSPPGRAPSASDCCTAGRSEEHTSELQSPMYL